MTTTPADQVGTQVGNAVDSAKEVVADNMPLVFSVALGFVAWGIGRRVLGKI